MANPASLRIAFFLPSFLPKCSGAEIFHHNLAMALGAHGHQVCAVIPRSYIRRMEEAGWCLPYTTIPYPANFWSAFKRVPAAGFILNRVALGRIQRRHRFDVWHAAVFSPTGICLADWQEHGGPPGLVRAVGDDAISAVELPRNPDLQRLVETRIPRAQAVVALSESMRASLLEAGVPSDRLHVFPNAVDTGRFDTARRDGARERLRRSLGLPGNAFLFLCVGRNHAQKDFPTLLSAFSLLRERHPSARLAIAGRDAHGLADAVQATGNGDAIFLRECIPSPAEQRTGSLPPAELIDLYLGADAFVLSSLLEGFSTALLEAMAAGLPIVGTDVPGIRDQVNDGDNGLLVAARTPGALADGMGRLLVGETLRARLSAAARSTAERLSWKSLAAAYESLYRRLVAQHPSLQP